MDGGLRGWGVLTGQLRVLILEQLRSPITLIGDLVLPVAGLVCYLVLFPAQDGPARADVLARFLVLAATTPALFTVLLTLATDRQSAWGEFLRTLPAPVWVRPTAAVLAGLLTAAVAALLVAAAGFGLGLTPVAGALVAGLFALVPPTMTVALLALTLGQTVTVRSAVAVGQCLFLTLVFGGGLLLPPESVTALSGASRWLVTGSAVTAVSELLSGRPPDVATVLRLLGWVLGSVLAALVVLSARRSATAV